MKIENLNEDQENVVDSHEEEEIDQGTEINENDNIDENLDNAEETFEEEIDDEGENEQEVADPEKNQSKEENSQYRKMRLKAEEAAQVKYQKELEQIKAEKAELESIKEQQQYQKVSDDVYNNFVTDERIQNEALNRGIDEETARMIIQSEAGRLAEIEKNKLWQRNNAIQMQEEKFKSNPYYKYVNQQVKELIRNNHNIDYKTAFNYHVGENIIELNKKVSKDTEQNVIARTQARNNRRNVGGSDGATNGKTPPISSQAREMAEAFGISVDRTSKRIAKAKRSVNKK